MLRFQIVPRQPFAFDLALAYLSRSPSTIVEVITPTSYRRPLRRLTRHGTGVALLDVRTGAESSALEVTVTGSDLDDEDTRGVETLVRQLFHLDDDLAPFYEAIQADPTFSALARDCRGLRPVLIPDLFETIVWAIIGQQINVQFAAKCKRALVERFGEVATIDGQSYRLFPEPARLAEIPEAELAAIQFSRQKIRYVLGLSREVAAGRFNLDELRREAPEAALTRLQQILGVGRWTAEYVLMRGLGHRDVIPAGDGGLRRIIGERYGFGRSASETEVRALAERWAGWRGYAAFYWWYALQLRLPTPGPIPLWTDANRTPKEVSSFE